MSIIDNDSTTSTRTTPTLNVNDDGGVRKAHNTYGNTLRRVGSAVKQFLSFGQGTIEAKDADGNKSFFIGYDPALSTRPVIRVAKDGFDAQTGLDSNMIFNSEQNVFKIVKIISYTTPAVINFSNPGVGNFGSNTQVIATLPHGLGYAPLIVPYMDLGGSGFAPLPYTTYFSAATNRALWYTFDAKVTETNVLLSFSSMQYNESAAVVPGFIFKFYLLQETAN
jgi:hypothetical protein